MFLEEGKGRTSYKLAVLALFLLLCETLKLESLLQDSSALARSHARFGRPGDQLSLVRQAFIIAAGKPLQLAS